MANGIDSQYTGIGRVPIVQEDTTSIWDAIVPLAQMAKADTARQEKLKLDYAALQQKRDADDDLNQYRQDSLDQQSTYQKGQLDIAQERNQIAKMEFEKRKADENEREQVTAIQQIADDYKEQVKQYRALAESTGKNSYNMLADNIESRGIEKEGIEPIKSNLMQENNPFKIREYLRLHTEELDSHFPGASAMLSRKAKELEAEYNVTSKEVTDSEIFKTAVEQINQEQKDPAGGFKDGYNMGSYERAISQARMATVSSIQSPAVPEGVAPFSEEDISMIWDNPQARDTWLTNPLDDINEIKKKFGMLKEEEGEEDDDKGDEEVLIPTAEEIEKQETEARAESYKNIDQLKDEIDNLISKKNILSRLQGIGRLNENQAKELIKIENLLNKAQANLGAQKKISQAGMKRREAATGRYYR
jgi:hypothetical protein